MNLEARQSRVTTSRMIAGFGAVCSMALGSSILIGWITGIEAFRNFLHPQRVSMNAAPAICFVLVGAALWVARDSRKRTPKRDLVRMILAGLAVLISLAKYIDMLPSIDVPIDRILFADSAVGNRMSPNTALGFILVGTSLLLLERRYTRGLRPSTVLAVLAVSLSALAITGYLYEVQALYRMSSSYKPMSPNTAIGMLLLSVGILCARPDRQPVVTLISGTFGGVVARRLLPVAIVLPILLGWLKLHSERRGVLDGESGILLFALAIVAVFLVLTWLVARSLYRLDIERARAEALVADNLALIRTLIDNLPDRIYAKDTESRFLINNAAHLGVLGAASQSDALGKRDEDFWSAEQAAKFHAEEKQIIETGQPILDQEQRRTTKTGEERWVTVTKVPFRNAQGAVSGIVGITHDVTAMKHAQALLSEQNEMLGQSMASEKEAHDTLKKAQSQLVQSEKLASLGQMVAGVAHEINNPLSFVANNVAVLQRDLRAMASLLELYAKADPTIAEKHPELSGEIKDLAERIDLAYTLPNIHDLLNRSRDGLKRIQQIVKDLRDFARLDESDLHEVDLNDGIRSTANIILGVAKKKRVKVDLELADLPTVSCYPAKVNQVVMNLISNAIQASHEGGTVTVRSKREGADQVVIEVADQGTGIPQKIRDRIFDPFFTTKPPGEGTGLGLSISYGIIHDHGGRIDVQSEEGKGATFTITLPTQRAPRPPRVKNRSEEGSPRRHGEHGGAPEVIVQPDKQRVEEK